MYDAITVDPSTRTIRPVHKEADDFFGLTSHVFGTGPTARRAAITPPGYQWLRSDGRPAVGICYQVSEETIEIDLPDSYAHARESL